MRKDSDKKFHLILLAITLGFFIWSAINPEDYFTWVLEVFPAIIGFFVLLFTYRKFRLSNLSYVLITIHAIVLMIGGHYTYAKVPFFSWLKDIGLFSRNNYDKVGHLMQGFVPAIIAREILLRKSPLKRGKWLGFIVITICLAISALYEILEWLVSSASGSAGDAFLGTQGYIFDTQSDMLFALIGSVAALLILSRLHDKSMSHIKKSAN